MTGASSEQAPKPGMLTFALTILLSLVVAIVARAGGPEDENFYAYMRPRVGYFSRYDPGDPYSNIYEHYFLSVIQKRDRAMESTPQGDWRRVRPTGELCLDFLIGLEVRSFVMSKPYEVIILDACLDWLFDESDNTRREAREEDVNRFDNIRKDGMQMLKNAEKLRSMYQSTRFAKQDGLPNKLKKDIHEYLMKLLKVFADHPRNGCHSLWLEAYNDFIDETYVGDCDDETNCNFYNLEGSDQDSYLRMIAESTREASKSCYHVMQRQMRGLMETEFEQSNSSPSAIKQRFTKNRVSRQIESEKWTRELVSILQLASGVSQDTIVNLGDVAGALDKIKNSDKETVKRFTDALSQYAVDHYDPKDSNNDPNGRARYGHAMTKLCRPYIDYQQFLGATGGVAIEDEQSERKPFEFYNLIYSLVRITNHNAIFGITKDRFEEDVMQNRWEALYLATFACQIISTTWGELTYETNLGRFDVLLRPDAGVMIADWPIEVLRNQLPANYPKFGSLASSKHSNSEKNSGDTNHATFGVKSKFKLNFKLSGNRHKEGEEEATTTAPLTDMVQILKEPNKTPLPAPTAAPVPMVRPRVAPAKEMVQPRNEAEVISLDTIKTFKALHGRYPKLPDHYKHVYPELFDNLSATSQRQYRPASHSLGFGSSLMTPTKRPARPNVNELASLKF